MTRLLPARETLQHRVDASADRLKLALDFLADAQAEQRDAIAELVKFDNRMTIMTDAGKRAARARKDALRRQEADARAEKLNSVRPDFDLSSGPASPVGPLVQPPGVAADRGDQAAPDAGLPTPHFELRDLLPADQLAGS